MQCILTLLSTLLYSSKRTVGTRSFMRTGHTLQQEYARSGMHGHACCFGLVMIFKSQFSVLTPGISYARFANTCTMLLLDCCQY